MKSAHFLILFALASPAAAQNFTFHALPSLIGPFAEPWPQTVPMVANDTGKQIGTATYSGGRAYLRNMKGELVAQVIREGDTLKLLDPSGKLLEEMPVHKAPEAYIPR